MQRESFLSNFSDLVQLTLASLTLYTFINFEMHLVLMVSFVQQGKRAQVDCITLFRSTNVMMNVQYTLAL